MKDSVKLVKKEPIQLSTDKLCEIMDSIPDSIDDAKDMQRMINAIWPLLVEYHSINQDQSSIIKFLEEHAPVYDNCQNIEPEHHCEITLLMERERLYQIAKGRL